MNRKFNMKNVKNNSYPLITIITVVFNSEKYLEDAIKSVINQTYPNVEYIIIDGGSTDGTLDIIRKYEDKIDCWISEKDCGIYDAINKGIKLARGDIIGILNSDDYYYPEALDIVVKYFQKGYDFVFGTINYNNEAVITGFYPEKIDYKMQVFPSHSAGFFVKKELHEKVGLYKLKYRISSDYDFIYKLIKNNYKGICSKKDELVGFFRKGGFSSENVFNNLLEEALIRFDNGENKVKVISLLFLKLIKNFSKF